MTRAELLAAAAPRLKAAGVDQPMRDARLLLRHAGKLEAAALTARMHESPAAEEINEFNAAIDARCRRQPLAQIVGYREFFGRRFRVTSDVLDPRPESETLIDAALSLAPARRILDLGTGSGALLLTMLAEWPDAFGLGIDSSEAALDVARHNAHMLSVDARAELRRSDWLAGVEGLFDLILCNPPYVSEAEYRGLSPEIQNWEPMNALTPGGDGLGVYRRVAHKLRLHLSADGAALFECGAGQGKQVSKILSVSSGLSTILIQDINHRTRCLLVQRRHSVGKIPPKTG